jgi:hypothetical protein
VPTAYSTPAIGLPVPLQSTHSPQSTDAGLPQRTPHFCANRRAGTAGHCRVLSHRASVGTAGTGSADRMARCHGAERVCAPLGMVRVLPSTVCVRARVDGRVRARACVCACVCACVRA